MPRPSRFVLPGHPHHLLQRGNNRNAVFFHKEDYQFFLKSLQAASARYNCQIHAYVLMTNHIHLLVSPATADGLARLMQSIGRRYVPYINQRYQRSGTLWEGRYRAVLLETARYVLACQRYIELNPVRAQIVQRAADYVWSSYRHHALGAPDALVHDHTLYTALGPDTASRCSAYQALCTEALAVETMQAIRDATNTGWVLGDTSFTSQVEKILHRRVRPAARGGYRPGAGRPQKRTLESNPHIQGKVHEHNIHRV
jgi:putative transposase